LEKHPSKKYASVDVLQPGLSYEEIDRRVVDLPFKLPEEAYELYHLLMIATLVLSLVSSQLAGVLRVVAVTTKIKLNK
jgi:hypothetical protein